MPKEAKKVFITTAEGTGIIGVGSTPEESLEKFDNRFSRKYTLGRTLQAGLDHAREVAATAKTTEVKK